MIRFIFIIIFSFRFLFQYQWTIEHLISVSSGVIKVPSFDVNVMLFVRTFCFYFDCCTLENKLLRLFDWNHVFLGLQDKYKHTLFSYRDYSISLSLTELIPGMFCLFRPVWCLCLTVSLRLGHFSQQVQTQANVKCKCGVKVFVFRLTSGEKKNKATETSEILVFHFPASTSITCFIFHRFSPLEWRCPVNLSVTSGIFSLSVSLVHTSTCRSYQPRTETTTEGDVSVSQTFGSSSHSCCFTVRLDRRSDNINKKHFPFSLVYLWLSWLCYTAYVRADCSRCTCTKTSVQRFLTLNNGVFKGLICRISFTGCLTVATQKLPEQKSL